MTESGTWTPFALFVPAAIIALGKSLTVAGADVGSMAPAGKHAGGGFCHVCHRLAAIHRASEFACTLIQKTNN